jgi:hypothetical protein
MDWIDLTQDRDKWQALADAGAFLDYLRTSWFLKKHSGPWSQPVSRPVCLTTLSILPLLFSLIIFEMLLISRSK